MRPFQKNFCYWNLIRCHFCQLEVKNVHCCYNQFLWIRYKSTIWLFFRFLVNKLFLLSCPKILKTHKLSAYEVLWIKFGCRFCDFWCELLRLTFKKYIDSMLDITLIRLIRWNEDIWNIINGQKTHELTEIRKTLAKWYTRHNRRRSHKTKSTRINMTTEYVIMYFAWCARNTKTDSITFRA